MVNIWFDLIGTFDLFPLEAFCFWKSLCVKTCIDLHIVLSHTYINHYV